MALIDNQALLKRVIEAESQGARTALFTAKNQISYFNVFEKFDLSVIDSSLSGTHPAFIINGVEVSKIYIGAYPGVIKNGELLSLPNQQPTINTSYDQFVAAAKACGNGFHMMTAAEWSLAALRSYMNGTQPQGNTYWGRSADDATQFGRRIDGKAVGTVPGATEVEFTDYNSLIYNGSGPVKFRHNAKYTGVSDLGGGINQFCSGVRLIGKELQVIANNDAAMTSADLSAASALWKAIDATNGNLITPNGSGTTTNSIKFAANGTVADYSISISGLFGNLTNPSTTAPVSQAAMNKLKALGLFPLISSRPDLFGNDLCSINLDGTGELIMHKSASKASGTGGGIFAQSMSFSRAATSPNHTSRPCYYIV
ncbi:hypothetical protein J5N52_12285 [Acinetobacter soli]|uniref:hypothetical protein n=1 Tax=Acinetobacter soli TaxID=487316 RepID=UPI001ABCA33E|nr:hypothetical protein [Acinetobacter soli]MBO3672787.1 hypothetical protein [Acinetobacter soli]